MSRTKILISTVVGVILIATGFIIVPYYVTKSSWYWTYDQNSALIGDTIGGIVGPIIGLFGVILTFLAFYIQYAANNVQRKALFIDQFESKFFELLRMHRENIKDISYDDSKGLYAVKKLSSELQQCMSKLDNLNNNSFSDKTIIIIGFHFFYFGIDNQTKKKITTQISIDGKDKESLIKLIFRELDTWKKEDTGAKVITDHESRIEIYLKHIFHMVSFLENQKAKLSNEEYQFFSDTIISQLSTNEVNMLLYYAISNEGNQWFAPINFVKKYDLLSKIKDDSKGIEKESLQIIINNYEKSI